MLTLEVREARHQPFRGERRQSGDGERPVLAEARDLRRAFRQLLEGGLDRAEEALAGFGQAYLARLALEQGLAQPLLQRLDLVADGAVGDVQLLRRLGKALQSGGGLEIMH